jgi:broad specificity phosphatase PhoE
MNPVPDVSDVFRSLTLYVIRHGECEHNVARRAASQNDSALTQRGHDQARANGMLLKDLASPLDRFRFFASPLHRTCVTMEIVREAAGLAPTGYFADRRLMEIDFGDHTWMTREEIGLDAQARFLADPWNHAQPNGESQAMLFARVGRFLQTLSGDAVIVTHAWSARMIRAHYLGLPPEDTVRYDAPHAGILRLFQGTETIFGD